MGSIRLCNLLTTLAGGCIQLSVAEHIYNMLLKESSSRLYTLLFFGHELTAAVGTNYNAKELSLERGDIPTM